MRCSLCSRKGGGIVANCSSCTEPICGDHLLWDTSREPAAPVCARCVRLGRVDGVAA